MISVIVPIYNTEKYLRKCLDSIVNQTYRDLQIILVDDGSPDNCGRICDEYVERDERISVIHQENAGLSAARNSGLEVASGEYITFVDSDDFMDLDAFSCIFRNLASEPDVLIYRDRITDIYGNPASKCMAATGKVTVGDGTFFLNLVITRLLNSVCDKVYKKSVVGNSRFPSGKVHGEDYLFNLEVASSIRSAVYVDEIKYNTVVNMSSITRKGFNSSTFDQIAVKEMVSSFIDEHFPAYSSYGHKQLFLAKLHIMRPIFYAKVEKQYADEIHRLCEELKSTFNEVKLDLNRIQTMEYHLFVKCRFFYRFFLFILKIIKKG